MQVWILILLKWNEIVFVHHNKSSIKHAHCTSDYIITVNIEHSLRSTLIASHVVYVLLWLHSMQNAEHRQDYTCMAQAPSSEQKSANNENACCIHAPTRSFANIIMLESLEFLFLFLFLLCIIFSIQHFLSSMYFIRQFFTVFFFLYLQPVVVGCWQLLLLLSWIKTIAMQLGTEMIGDTQHTQ